MWEEDGRGKEKCSYSLQVPLLRMLCVGAIVAVDVAQNKPSFVLTVGVIYLVLKIEGVFFIQFKGWTVWSLTSGRIRGERGYCRPFPLLLRFNHVNVNTKIIYVWSERLVETNIMMRLDNDGWVQVCGVLYPTYRPCFTMKLELGHVDFSSCFCKY